MNKKNGIFTLSTIISLLVSLVAAIIVWLFAKYGILSGETQTAFSSLVFRLIL